MGVFCIVSRGSRSSDIKDAVGELIKGDFLINFSDNVAGLQDIFHQL
jgi:hypothetical protein